MGNKELILAKILKGAADDLRKKHFLYKYSIILKFFGSYWHGNKITNRRPSILILCLCVNNQKNIALIRNTENILFIMLLL